MADYTVSVIVPVYNAERYIAETMKSICNQTYRDFEIILVDDECSDNSIPIANRILQKSGIKSNMVRQKNKGLPGARNTGMEQAKGEYVCFIDSDDLISPTHLSDLISVIKENGTDVAFSMFEYTKEVDRFGRKNGVYKSQVFEKEKFLYNFVRRRPAVHCCSLMIKLSLLKKDDLFFNEILKKYGEDVEFMWRLFPKVNKIACTGNYTYKYLVREKSLMTVGEMEPWDVFLKEFMHTIKAECRKQPELSKYYLWAYYRTLMGVLRIIAESAGYKVFRSYADKLVTEKMMQSMKSFPDSKMRFMAVLLRNQKRIYYALFRKRIRFYNESRILNRE